MKIIDLLNKIANGEEMPKAVNSATGSICYYLYDKCGEQCDDRGLYKILNDEIEIIEEEKKIPEKIDQTEIEVSMAIGEQICANKINEIIEYLNSKGDE